MDKPFLGLSGKVFMVAALLPVLLTAIVLWSWLITGGAAPQEMAETKLAMAMRGFANLWAAGQAAWQPEAAGLLTDQERYAAWTKSLFGAGYIEQMWGYPPSMLLPASLLGLLPMGLGFLLWTLGGMAALWFAARAAGLALPFRLALMASPAVLDNAVSGQTGAYVAALMLMALVRSSAGEVSAGASLALLTLKPQLGILLPIPLLLRGRWRAICVAVAGSVVLVGMTGLIFGFGIWHGFLTETSGFMRAVLERPWVGAPAQANFASPFMAFRAMGASLWLAWCLQGLVAVMCIAATTLTWRAPAAREARLALILALTCIATPYAHGYDLPILALAILFLVSATGLGFTIGPGGRMVLGLAWFWPGAMVLFAAIVPAYSALSPVLASISAGAVALLAWRACKAARPASQDG